MYICLEINIHKTWKYFKIQKYLKHNSHNGALHYIYGGGGGDITFVRIKKKQLSQVK